MHPMTFRRWLALLLFSLTLLPALASALFEDDLLDPDDAFALQAEALEGDLLRLTWTIADGYYMYREQFRFTADSEGLEFGEPRIPDGTVKEDEFFGRVETYRDRIEIELPVLAATSREIELTARSQGCADVGVCYPPHFQTVSLTLPELPTAQPAAPADNGRAALDALAELSGGLDDELLEPEVAFAASARAISQNAVVLRFDIADGYYLYRDKLGFRIAEGEGIELGPVNPPDGTLIVDEFFGETETYRESVEILVPVLRTADDVAEIVLAVDYQGCADIGVCYPPLTQDVAVAFASDLADEAEELPATGTEPPAVDDAVPVTEQDRIAAQLADGRVWLIALAFFGFGLLLTFTPCVFPMIPILSNIIIGQKNLTTRKAFFISLAFVLAMAFTYTLAGVFAGMAGANLQAAFQNPWIIGGFVLVFIALALSMFGFYELQMPSSIQSRLTNVSNRQEGGTLAGAAVMGFLAALIVGPCVTAPLVGALLYISQTGDAVLGGIALFSLSMGMGAPLLAIGTSAGKILPKAGPWMDTVKAVFGVGLLAMGIWLLERVIPGEVALLLWATLLIVTAIYMGALQTLPEAASGWRSLWKGLGLVLLLYGVILMLGAFTGGKDMFRPLAELRAPAAALVGPDGAPRATQMEFREVDSLADVEREVAEAAARNQPVFLDFYADWCVDCVRLERTTFQDPRVIQAMSDVHLLKADVTANTSEHRDLMRAFNLFGPPAMIFYDHDGEELRHRRVVGFLNAERFLAHVEQSIGARP
ncbi:protein-disulfide reductase DsbD [Thioalkalivibrio paradoxus]|uniref:Thiol:disulfide interchange protein DsbD n=1 Tax=Thioalkalivibrio paradoxus ARh 1 TaxID=713585 RepID=W0DQZ6_9GAMM|nr:protein-disulfide reductase DsbD [Thioalkalivibrio paradoxus]AHE99418.1 thiol:disulfide interchange protein [Thioalkalivibrio paradoxus ARh 1]